MAIINGTDNNDNSDVHNPPISFRKLTGTLNDDSIFGFSGNDILIGLAGADLLDGGKGADTMEGGDGNDTYIVDDLSDKSIEATDAKTGGVDTVQSSVSRTLGFGLENLILTGSANNSGFGNALNNRLTGNSSNNSLFGLDGNDHLLGEQGNDVLAGNNGEDYLDGGAGTDHMEGGSGNDTYVVDFSLDKTIEALDGLSGGIDTVFSSITRTLDFGLENLTLIGLVNISGIGNTLDNVLTGNSVNNVLSGLDGKDRLFGNAGSDILLGGTGDDRLDGGAGADNMQGGDGNDSYIIDDLGDVISEAGDDTLSGIDTVYSHFNHFLGTRFENLVLINGITGSGNSKSNSIQGNTNNNNLFGGFGDDFLNGMAGNDQLAGEAGNDDLKGGDGDDNLSGGIGNDILDGDNGNDFLDGGDGADLMRGGFGNDKYFVDNVGDVARDLLDNVVGGIDLVISSVSIELDEGIDNVELQGAGILAVRGNELNNVIDDNTTGAGSTIEGGLGNDTLNGFAGDDELLGGNGNDSLNGGEGADELFGGGGADNMVGGNGNDRYWVDDMGDVVTEIVGGGGDHVTVQVEGDSAITSYTLGTALESLEFRGELRVVVPIDLDGEISAVVSVATVLPRLSTPITITGTGNDLDNFIFVTFTNDETSFLIHGLGGNDEIGGGIGNDTLFGDAGNDILRAGPSLAAPADLTIPIPLDKDILNGGTGIDEMHGGIGNDTYVVDHADDLTIEEFDDRISGTDTVNSSVTRTLGFGLENLSLIGTAAIAGTGNNKANAIVGNVGNNTLNGLGGNDILNGGNGTDILDGGAGNDILVAGSADNDTLKGGVGADFFLFNAALGTGARDKITDYNVVTDTIRLDNSIFTALTTLGTLNAANFKSAAAPVAADANDHILFNTANGQLFYDTDGNGAGAAQHFATLNLTGLVGTVTAADFVVV